MASRDFSASAERCRAGIYIAEILRASPAKISARKLAILVSSCIPPITTITDTIGDRRPSNAPLIVNPARRHTGGLFCWYAHMNLNFDKLNGLVTAVIQDHATGRVLMVAFMNE